mgnify:CR=1 FL=1|tara:strand:+ start:3460 stop:4011 length:552 start_codon:yes stop_codon:yes gene_type:complete
METFIQTFDDVIHGEILQRIIKRFNEIEEVSSFSGEAQFNSSLGRKDSSIMIEDHSPQLAGEIHGAIQPYLTRYQDCYAGAKELNIRGYNVKMQRTSPGGGYHVWHCEQGEAVNSRRLLVWMIYMNDVSEGGETEFLNQATRVQPKAGRLVIWPAAWPWQHRGNPPLKEDKYVCTGWWYFAQG